MAGFGSMLKGATLSGDWDKAAEIIGGKMKAELFLKKAKARAIRRAAAFAVRKIVENLDSSGALAGAPFAPLAESTIARRTKGRGKGGHKPLIDTGDLRGSVHPHYVNENYAFAGVKRGSIGKKTGEPRADIAMVMEYGAIRKPAPGAMHVTEAIPARPFIGPVVDKFGAEMGKVYARSIEESFEGVADMGGPEGGVPGLEVG